MDNEVLEVLATYLQTIMFMCLNEINNRELLVVQRRRAFRHRIRRMQLNYDVYLRQQAEVTRNLLMPLILRPLRNRMPNKIRSTHWWEHVVELHFTDSDWTGNFRMRRDSFEHLCQLLHERLAPNPTSVQVPIDVRKKVAVTVYKLASCAEYRVVANQFGVHASTVHNCVYAVVNAINEVVFPQLVAMPNEFEAQGIANQVEAHNLFPQAFLAIDGSHIPVLPPTDGYRDFINRKGWASVVLQGAVDNRFRFRNISCILPGSSHDARVLSVSSLFINSDVMIPKAPRHINGVEVPMMVLGDAAYPLLPWLMKGYTGTLTPEQESFNVYLSSFRMSVEIAFGRLKARWRCLSKRIDVNYTFVPRVVAACCTLHNYVENGKEPFVAQWLDDVRAAELIFPQPQRLVAREHDNYNMTIVRNHLCQHLAATLPLRRSSFRLNND